MGNYQGLARLNNSFGRRAYLLNPSSGDDMVRKKPLANPKVEGGTTRKFRLRRKTGQACLPR